MLASYFFYACWDWRFLFLLVFSTLLDYYSGIQISKVNSKKAKLTWFWLSVCLNLGFLGVFKYYNFFVASFAEGLSLLGIQANYSTLNIILPVGISFYTFHGLSYVIDVYKERITPEKNFINYALFVSFFPLLVAGPIERATHLLPQIKKNRQFNYTKAVDGCRQILWGLFKKMVIADNCAVFANDIFSNYEVYQGSTLVLGALFFAFQIYGDFSGYSDIALGTAKLFGIDLLRNFAFPYFSRNIAEFWRRWHISLSSWFRDYLYIPLGGSKGSNWLKVRNTFIIFLVSGFWHGANVTFIVWGALHALYIMPSIIFKRNRVHIDIVAKGSFFPSMKEGFAILITFALTCFAWIFFRAENMGVAIGYIQHMLQPSLFVFNGAELLNDQISIYPISLLLLFFFTVEWLGREQQFAIQSLFTKSHSFFRWAFYYVICYCIFIYSGQQETFIYFQF